MNGPRDREAADDARAEDRVALRNYPGPADVDRWGRDADWHYPRDLAPRTPR